MQRFLKIIFWTSIFILGFWTLILILRFFIPLDFTNRDSENSYVRIGIFGFSITATLFVLIRMIKRKHISEFIVIKIILANCVAVSFCIIMTVFLGSMCAWTTDKVFFENKQNSSIKIVQRHFGCGATDSSEPTIEVFKIREITPYLIWATKIDTNQIDKNEWIRVENN